MPGGCSAVGRVVRRCVVVAVRLRPFKGGGLSITSRGGDEVRAGGGELKRYRDRSSMREAGEPWLEDLVGGLGDVRVGLLEDCDVSGLVLGISCLEAEVQGCGGVENLPKKHSMG